MANGVVTRHEVWIIRMTSHLTRCTAMLKCDISELKAILVLFPATVIDSTQLSTGSVGAHVSDVPNLYYVGISRYVYFVCILSAPREL